MTQDSLDTSSPSRSKVAREIFIFVHCSGGAPWVRRGAIVPAPLDRIAACAGAPRCVVTLSKVAYMQELYNSKPPHR